MTLTTNNNNNNNNADVQVDKALIKNTLYYIFKAAYTQKC